MYDIFLPISIYLTDSILSGIYTQRFLKERYGKRAVFAAWSISYFLISIFVFEIMDSRFYVGQVAGVILNICVMLLMQYFLYEKDIQKQLFVSISFVAGKAVVKYIASVFLNVLYTLNGKITEYIIARGIITEPDRMYILVNATSFIIMLLGAALYALLLYAFLHLVSKSFVNKDYLLHTHENVFLILPCVAALCISITIKMMIISVENGMTVIIYDTVPATKFWIPVICVLLLSSVIASVILFQKLVQYNEETAKRVMLENQVRQMQREIAEIQDIYTDMRGLRHDMRSHMANISLLVKSATGSANKELEGYIGKMEETVRKLDFTCQTGNPITDIIIHQKRQEAEKKQILFDVDFTYPAKLLTDAYDIAVILNNALENAIEACCKAEGEKQISLRSYVKGSLFFIEIENDFSGEIVIDEESGLPVSSKGNGKLHGIGISNIQRCAKKYMGDIDIVISDTGGRKKFSITVMMNGKHAAAS